MHEKRKLFVLVVESDPVVAATIAAVVHTAGYMVGIAQSHVAALRIASRMVVDAGVIDVGANPSVNIETAAVLQDQYPDCRILLLCARSQTQETEMLAEEDRVQFEILARPLSRAELLAKLATAPGVSRGVMPVSTAELQAA